MLVGLFSSVKRRMSSRDSQQSSCPVSTSTGSANASPPLPLQPNETANIMITHANANTRPPEPQPPPSTSSSSSTSTSTPSTLLSTMGIPPPAVSSTETPPSSADTFNGPKKRWKTAKKTVSEFERKHKLHVGNTPQMSSNQAETANCEEKSLPEGLLVANQGPKVFSELPLMRDCATPEAQQQLLLKKLAACRDVVFDFRIVKPIFDEEKELKKQTLNEILEWANSSKAAPSDQLMESLMGMITANIFRPMPPVVTPFPFAMLLNDLDDSDPPLEPAWFHLQVVYEIFLRFVMSSEVNPKTAKRYIDHEFVLKLLDLFSTEDPRERDYLKTIVHRIYGKIMALRSFIRRAIQQVFFRHIYFDDRIHGISELLEILGSIINGFALPLKEEHKNFLKKSMIPLHKCRNLALYHQQLTYCMTQYIEKDVTMTKPIVEGLLRYWPVTNTPKEVLFLNELEEILEVTHPTEFAKIMEPLFQRMALCIESPHFQVSERVLFLWNNTRVVKLINQNKPQLFPIVISALYKNSKDHWNASVHGLTFNVSKLLAESDPALFDYCSDQNISKEEQRTLQQESRQRIWETLRKDYEEKVTTATSPSSSGTTTTPP